ncbi:MAG: zf-HC2 domain-containing protein [Lachnospiraceae bacterium]|nr:zf-HC2 domain-containing protein [Lachnospiraceae bacterium]
MTCLEAQSKIIAYIDYKLDREEKLQFLNHIENCPDCKDELNIYYTMIEGMRQLDRNQPLSKDFTEELESRIRRELRHDRKKRDFFRSSVCIVIVSVLGFFIFAYVNFLHLLHEEEQANLKAAQGDYYFSEMLDEQFFEPYDGENILNINVEDEEEERVDLYRKIRQHNMLQ